MLLYIDINDACNLKCTTCPRGVRAFPNTSKKMSLSMFRRIVEKGRHDGAYQVGLFNWVEPFLIDDLSEYTKIVKQFDLRWKLPARFGTAHQWTDTVSPFRRHVVGHDLRIRSVDL